MPVTHGFEKYIALPCGDSFQMLSQGRLFVMRQWNPNLLGTLFEGKEGNESSPLIVYLCYFIASKHCFAFNKTITKRKWACGCWQARSECWMEFMVKKKEPSSWLAVGKVDPAQEPGMGWCRQAWLHKTDMGFGGAQRLWVQKWGQTTILSGGEEIHSEYALKWCTIHCPFFLVRYHSDWSEGHAVNITSTEGYLWVDIRTESNSFYLA